MRRTLLYAVFAAIVCRAQSRVAPLIEFSFEAADSKGNPVTDLNLEDVAVTVDGQAREVAALHFDGAKEPESPPRPLGPGVFTNRPFFLHGPQRNVLAIVIGRRAWRAETLHNLLELASGMRIAVYQLGPPLRVVHDFNEGVESLSEQMSTFSQNRAEPPGPPAAQTLAAIEELGSHLAGIPGRKALIWIGPDPDGSIHPDDEALRATARRLATQGVAVYPSEGAMELMAEATGGRVWNAGDLTQGLKLAAADLRGSYTVEFRGPEEADGKWHDVAVKVRRRGVKVAHRQGYLADDSAAPPRDWSDSEWSAAIASPVGSTELRVVAQCELDASTLDARLQVPDQELYFREVEHELRAEVQFAIAEKGPAGGYSLQQRLATARVSDSPGLDLSNLATQLKGQWKLAPDTSVVRLIVRDRVTGRFGTLDLPVKSIPPPAPVSTEPPAEPTLPPAAPPPGSDPFVAKARSVSMAFLQTLPNYVVKQDINREVQTRTNGVWTVQDRIAAEVVYDGGKETIRDVHLNGKSVSAQKVEETGTWSTGQFGGMLKALFSVESAAVFHEHRNMAKVAGREARVYDFSVERANSQWVLVTSGKSYVPAYEGTVWLDRDTARALRFVIRARHLPSDFPFDAAESSTEYGMVRIGTGEYLLPTGSTASLCMRSAAPQAGFRRGSIGSGRTCTRNVIQFHDFKQFGTESNIDFGK